MTKDRLEELGKIAKGRSAGGWLYPGVQIEVPIGCFFTDGVQMEFRFLLDRNQYLVRWCCRDGTKKNRFEISGLLIREGEETKWDGFSFIECEGNKDERVSTIVGVEDKELIAECQKLADCLLENCASEKVKVAISANQVGFEKLLERL